MTEFDKIIIDDCQRYIERSWSARTQYLTHFVTINLAYLAGLYALSTGCQNKSAIEIFLSLIILLINISIFSMYTRENCAAVDNSEQINDILIREKKFNPIKHYIKSRNFATNDKFKKQSLIITLFVFTLFTILPLISIMHLVQKKNDLVFCNPALFISAPSIVYILWLWVDNLFYRGSQSLKRQILEICTVRNIIFAILFIIISIAIMDCFCKIVNDGA